MAHDVFRQRFCLQRRQQTKFCGWTRVDDVIHGLLSSDVARCSICATAEVVH